MDTKYTEIECLKLEIEKRMGKPLKSPTDFNQLSLRLQKELNTSTTFPFKSEGVTCPYTSEFNVN